HRGTESEVQRSRHAPADGHAAEHVDGQALTGDYGCQDGQPQDGLDQPLHAPGKIGQPDGGDSHRDSDMENREAKAVTSKVNRVARPPPPPQENGPKTPPPPGPPGPAPPKPGTRPPRRRGAASGSNTATVPNDPPIQKTSTSHRTPLGGGLRTPATTTSGRKLDCTIRTAHKVARTATASRAPSDPRRRRWPSPSGAKISERQSRTASSGTRTGCP